MLKKKYDNIEPVLIDARGVELMTGFSRSKIFEMLSAGQLPPSLKLGQAYKPEENEKGGV